MLWYVLKLLILLPLIGGLIWGSLRLLQKMQARCNPAASGVKAARVIETTMLSPTVRLAVIAFRGREILVCSSRHGLTRLAEVTIAETGE